MANEQEPIVVGVDGSPGADEAVAWAVEEARSRKVALRLVYGYGRDLTFGAVAVYGNLPVPELSHVRAVAEKILSEARARAGDLAPDVEVSTQDVDDDAGPALVDESARASMVVLGSRHLGRLGSALLGSVGGHVAARASCPVVVVRGPAGLSAEHPAVVVGVDGREDSGGVLEFGLAYASRRSLPVHAVLCWHPDIAAEMMWRPRAPAPERADAWLSEALAGWRERYPDVDVHGAVVREHPVGGLVEAATAQHLLVVGRGGHRGLPGAVLGSVSQGVLHHATCPVAVVPR